MTNHTHAVTDADTRFIIDPITRQIKNTTKKKSLVQYDHNSERFTFECPRHIEGHDMSLCDRVEIHFVNTEKKNKENFNDDVYEVKDLSISQEKPDTVIFSWLISANATQLVGSLEFNVKFICEDEDYSWHTALCKDFSILEGMNNVEKVYEEYPDLYNALKADVLEEVNAELEEAKANGEFKGEKGDKGDKGDTPVKGTDYFTAADKTELVNSVLAALPTWEGGSY